MNRADLVDKFLACPRCHGPLQTQDKLVRCQATTCSFFGSFVDGVFLTEERPKQSFFDDKHESMQHGNEMVETKRLFYERQSAFAESFFAPGKTVLDVGCGPAFSYSKTPECFFIGLDYSLDSIRANFAADLRVYGSATALPLAGHSIDTVICFYSVHHMVGQKTSDTQQIVSAAFKEFGRVVKPGGDLLVFEVSPWWPFGFAEQVIWNRAKRALGPKLDMFFWPRSSLLKVARTHFPQAAFEQKHFSVSALFPVYPAIALPKLKIPRCLYPFSVCAYHWHF